MSSSDPRSATAPTNSNQGVESTTLYYHRSKKFLKNVDELDASNKAASKPTVISGVSQQSITVAQEFYRLLRITPLMLCLNCVSKAFKLTCELFARRHHAWARTFGTRRCLQRKWLSFVFKKGGTHSLRVNTCGMKRSSRDIVRVRPFHFHDASQGCRHECGQCSEHGSNANPFLLPCKSHLRKKEPRPSMFDHRPQTLR